jgi:hypothetical protein
MPRVAFITYAAMPELSADDRIGADALRKRGVAVESVVWDSPAVAWNSYDAIVVRSCWDYHVRAEEFRRWLDAVEVSGTPIWNPASILRWNMEKTYLRDLEARGIPIVATRWIEGGDGTSLDAILKEEGWRDAVVKPVLSASAYETWRTSSEQAHQDEDRFRALVERGGVMVQPFLPAVGGEGEWSLLFFAGNFSHAVLKRAARGDFRVQESFGGVASSRAPGERLLAQARAVVDAVPRPWLYARVDGCVVEDRFLLMELEMLEPSLFLSRDPAAPGRFADGVVESLRRV